MEQETMTIRQMCDTFNVTARALRFYESKELLAPIRVGQKRLFTQKDRARLKLILRGKRFGFSLEEMRRILALYEPDGDNVAQMKLAVETGRSHLLRMIEERDRLEGIIAELRDELADVERQLASVSPNPAHA